jgi:NAD(P)-dependent dehydrogenase (short-subunit alcohol dehydrogenase family)
MGSLDGRVAVVTGAGRGLGAAHAKLLAREGARVVVNDLQRRSEHPAADVVEEIRAAGGEAVASGHDITEWDSGRALVELAVSSFGRLDVLVNNAGALRDQFLVTMSEQDWDFVTRVNLKGHFVPTRWAASYWRDRAKAGEEVRASVVHTSSSSGLFGNPGQSNYIAAKAGVGMFSQAVATELERYGVRSNCIVPAARTRLTEAVPSVKKLMAAPEDDGAFDVYDPANVSPVVAYLATADCPITGGTFYVRGGHVTVVESWSRGPALDRDARWTVDELTRELPGLVAKVQSAR